MILESDHIWVKMLIDKFRKNSIAWVEKKLYFFQSLNDQRFNKAIDDKENELNELIKASDYQILMIMIYRAYATSDDKLHDSINQITLGGDKFWTRNII